MAKDEVRYTTPPFILHFPNVFEAQSMEGGEAKFNCVGIWTPAEFNERAKAQWAELKKAVDAECMRVHKMSWADAKAPDGVEDFKTGLRDGGSNKKKDLEGFGKGKIYATLSSKFQPEIVDVKKRVISLEEGNADLVYAGCYARARVVPFAFSNVSDGLSLGLRSLQIISSDKKRFPVLITRGKDADNFDEDIESEFMDAADESLLDDDIPF